jgi:hypothetical protein
MGWLLHRRRRLECVVSTASSGRRRRVSRRGVRFDVFVHLPQRDTFNYLREIRAAPGWRAAVIHHGNVFRPGVANP